MSVAKLLGVASVGRVAALLALVAMAAAGGGFWAGQEWRQGRTAQAQVVGLQADAAELRQAVEELRRRARDAAQDMRTAARRMDAISLDHWRHVDALDSLYADHRDALDMQIATAAAAQLRACRIGDFGLQLWAAAAAGHALDAAAVAGPATEPPSAGVPGGTTDTGNGYGRGGDAGMDRSRTDLPPLPPGQDGVDTGGGQL